MSTIKNPAEKKRVAYERDHYNRNGENNKSWRKAKPKKKAKARRAFRKASNDLVRVYADDSTVPVAAAQRRVTDWGVIGLRAFVDERLARRQVSVGAKKARKAKKRA